MAERSPFEPKRPEPEIIPPDRNHRERRDAAGLWTTHHRIVLVRPGPLAWLVGLLALAALAAIGFLLFLGFFFIVLPAFGVLALIVVLTALIKGAPRHL